MCVQVIQFLRMFLFYVSESIKFYFCLLNVIIKYKAWRFLPIEPTPYVNDTSFFLKNNKNSFRQLTETFSTSSQYSCLGTDYEKNEFAGVGVLKIRSSRPKVFCKKGVLRNFCKFRGKHLCQSLSFNKVTGLRPATLLKKRLWHRCFPVNFAKFLRSPFFIEHLWWLLLVKMAVYGMKFVLIS